MWTERFGCSRVAEIRIDQARHMPRCMRALGKGVVRPLCADTWPAVIPWVLDQCRPGGTDKALTMPHSTRRKAAATRAATSGERLRAAAAGITRGNRLGFDECTPAQTEFRAILALHLFNCGKLSALPGRSSTHSLTWYTITVSPRYNDLVLITSAPDNVCGYLVQDAGDEEFNEIPGLRLESRGTHIFSLKLRHMATGATMTVTYNRNGRHDEAADPGLYRERFATLDMPLTDTEKRFLAGLPQPSPDARSMLAALVARFSATDQHRRWALAQWYSDPLRRPDAPRHPWADEISRRLAGDGDLWELRWDSHPRPEDIVGALTDPVTGLAGARASKAGGDYVIAYRSARLTVGRF